ncbi:FAH family protein [Mesorhizobium sp. M7A.F.Ca.US.006.04.2.1]|uniref:AraD1 family protein n=1 Tax=unclassified Mesorhizobium TaxID=325217 RepID=UPI000FCCD557|nr:MULTISPECIES: AraD1 family protein [unclassified Mesorhizobium]RUX78032.1 FAH family protein [Mesorhizobium sp. M7A.F.Ca.US.005.03.1.1]RUY13314.1 FAH family protein [Mesorhizobium sp. M7A.F.Ca.US.005.03.2.1]RUY28295.1 FAH family protein [Mesorhizobium sp. M7A.F.Ca.US.001.04.2.1]RUY37443.1 FAH family protein [Mesorhizobium sp. M7A.F.Ca.US.001.04.1.1]RVA13855.1 FAH family protein [Mesorhizobium sp. M7A.F.Ca.US.002.01.1.1]
MRLVQFRMADGSRGVGRVCDDGNHLHPLEKTSSVLELAEAAIAQGTSIAALVEKRTGTAKIDYDQLLRDGQVLAPVDHPEPARFLVTGTGLTHTGSAAARNQMHVLTHGEGADESDSLKIFRMGLEGGKPGAGKIGIQPEWFFKGVGTCVVPPGAPLPMPAFAKAGAEEAEIVGLYVNGPDGHPYRIGYALGNEYSDHVTEGENYLYLAHSKLRSCSIGPELLIGDLPEEVRGHSRILRDGTVIWEQEFLSGEAHMSHSIANLEHFHFRYPMHRRAGDLHAYFFGAAVMSYASGVKTASGDEYEIQAQTFGKPLRNRMVSVPDEGLVAVTQL